MSEMYCGNCGGVRIGDHKFCIICGAKFTDQTVPKCPTCNQDWPDAPQNIGGVVSSTPAPPPPLAPPSPDEALVPAPSLHQVIAITESESKLEGSLNLLARQIRWADTFAKGKDCLNCGCPDSLAVCTVCGFTK